MPSAGKRGEGGGVAVDRRPAALAGGWRGAGCWPLTVGRLVVLEFWRNSLLFQNKALAFEQLRY